MSSRPRQALAEIPGIGNSLAAKLARRGITTRAQLRAIIDELPAETQAHIRHNITRSIPLAVGRAIVAELKRRLTYEGPTGRRRKYPAVAVGSVRREAPTSKDIDVLVVIPDDAPLQGVLASAELGAAARGDMLSIAESYASGQRRHSFIVRRARSGGRPKYYAVDLFLATKAEKPFALFHYSNGRDYNIRVRAHAKRRGWKLDQYGIFVAGAASPRRAPGSKNIKTERDLARFLGITYRAPKERANAQSRRQSRWPPRD